MTKTNSGSNTILANTLTNSGLISRNSRIINQHATVAIPDLKEVSSSSSMINTQTFKDLQSDLYEKRMKHYDSKYYKRVFEHVENDRKMPIAPRACSVFRAYKNVLHPPKIEK